MGFQQYIIFFNTDEEYENILKVIEKHNNEPCVLVDGNYDCEAGEELFIYGIVDVIKPYKTGIAKGCIKGLICSNGGGRETTQRYLFMNKVRSQMMTEAIFTRTKIRE